jgi:hypothetical protein
MNTVSRVMPMGEEACILRDAAKTKDKQLMIEAERGHRKSTVIVNFELLQLKYSLHVNMTL